MTRALPNKRSLTEGFVRKLGPKQGSFLVWDLHTRGLAIRVEPTGAKSWMVYYRHSGKVRWYRIGGASSIELKDARTLAFRVLFQVAEGKDPQAERAAERTAGTFEELATRYVEQYSKKENKSWRQADSLVRKHLFPNWAKMRAACITRGDVKAIKAAIESPTVANQTLAAASSIFSWAIREEVGNITVNPVKCPTEGDGCRASTSEVIVTDLLSSSECPTKVTVAGRARPSNRHRFPRSRQGGYV